MPDAVRTGRVVNVSRSENPRATVKVDVLLDGDKNTKKVAAWPTTGGQENPKLNPAAQVQPGDYGTFEGYLKDEEYEGKSFTRFYATSFKPLEMPATPSTTNGHASGGSEFTSSTSAPKGLLSPRERAAECAKENINHLIETGNLKEVREIPGVIHALVDAYAAAVAGE